ncbi:hypothetical protein LINGRAHAP2_LOCUS27237 [Linum grandiflorum]
MVSSSLQPLIPTIALSKSSSSQFRQQPNQNSSCYKLREGLGLEVTRQAFIFL